MRTAKEKAAATIERHMILGELIAEVYAVDDLQWRDIADAFRVAHLRVRMVMHPEDRDASPPPPRLTSIVDVALWLSASEGEA